MTAYLDLESMILSQIFAFANRKLTIQNLIFIIKHLYLIIIFT